MITKKIAEETVPIRGALRIKEAAQYLNVSEITVRRLVERGLLRPHRATRLLIFPIAELDRFLAEEG